MNLSDSQKNSSPKSDSYSSYESSQHSQPNVSKIESPKPEALDVKKEQPP